MRDQAGHSVHIWQLLYEAAAHPKLACVAGVHVISLCLKHMTGEGRVFVSNRLQYDAAIAENTGM